LKPERKLWQKVKKSMPEISFTRLENLSGFGTPDLLCYNKKRTFYTCELKVSKGNSVKLSPHQISFHVKHPHNTFILVSSDSYLDEKLYEGKDILLLASEGLKLAPLRSGLDLIYNYFQRL
jgi:Holliday junction resolvase